MVCKRAVAPLVLATLLLLTPCLVMGAPSKVTQERCLIVQAIGEDADGNIYDFNIDLYEKAQNGKTTLSLYQCTLLITYDGVEYENWNVPVKDWTWSGGDIKLRTVVYDGSGVAYKVAVMVHIEGEAVYHYNYYLGDGTHKVGMYLWAAGEPAVRSSSIEFLDWSFDGGSADLEAWQFTYIAPGK